jgi:pimeloyl-ACP methyl ester carboxylesterase
MSTANELGRTLRVHGMDLHYRVRGQGKPLVLLHGTFGTGDDWAHAFDLSELAREYQLVVPDLRGHGRSTNPDELFTTRQCARDVFALLDHLGVETFSAVGLSLGGNALLHMATAQPGRVDAMVLVAATAYFPEQARAIMRATTEASQSAEDRRALRARHAGGDDQVRALWGFPRAFAEGYDDMNFTPPYLSTITARTLVVNGDRDPLYPVEISVEMHRAIRGSALWVIPEGGHGPIFGPWREAFARTALAWVRGAPAVQRAGGAL